MTLLSWLISLWWPFSHWEQIVAKNMAAGSSRLTTPQLSISKGKTKCFSVLFTSVSNNPSEGLWVVLSHLSVQVNKGERKAIVINPRMKWRREEFPKEVSMLLPREGGLSAALRPGTLERIMTGLSKSRKLRYCSRLSLGSDFHGFSRSKWISILHTPKQSSALIPSYWSWEIILMVKHRAQNLPNLYPQNI